MAISGFRHKGLKQLFEEGKSAKIGKRYAAKALVILDYLDAIAAIEDCKGVQDFHELKGKDKGTYSMHVNGNYCITFAWDGQHVYDVDFIDYH
jgi:proteic killer suppression protein